MIYKKTNKTTRETRRPAARKQYNQGLDASWKVVVNTFCDILLGRTSQRTSTLCSGGHLHAGGPLGEGEVGARTELLEEARVGWEGVRGRKGGLEWNGMFDVS